jgi:signal transduction histidine kinase
MIEALQVAVTTHTIRLQLEKGPFWVKGDALRLEQVLQNLIQNALKYSPVGSTVTVTVTVTSHHLQVQITVNDQGIGIPASVMPTVFQRFARAHQGAARGVLGLGLGLGLYLSRVIMELHAGRIHVQSVEGEGCTATLLLPSVPLAPSPANWGALFHPEELGVTLDSYD